MKNKRGFTLTEVLVSIVIVGISLTAAISVSIKNRLISLKNSQKTNVIEYVYEIYNLYTLNPENFNLENPDATLKKTDKYKEIKKVDGTSDKYIIYFQNNFKEISSTETSTYLLLEYKKELGTINTTYTLTITAYIDDTTPYEVFNNTAVISRTIKVGN